MTENIIIFHNPPSLIDKIISDDKSQVIITIYSGPRRKLLIILLRKVIRIQWHLAMPHAFFEVAFKFNLFWQCKYVSAIGCLCVHASIHEDIRKVRHYVMIRYSIHAIKIHVFCQHFGSNFIFHDYFKNVSHVTSLFITIFW